MRRAILVPAFLLGVTAMGAAVGDCPLRGNFVQALSYSHEPPSESAATAAWDYAVLGWKVREGAYLGHDLSGLGLVAIVEPATVDKARPKAVLVVDDRANTQQRAALVSLARGLAGNVLGDTIDVRYEHIELWVGEGCAAGYAQLSADGLLVRTRRMFDTDQPCAMEPPVVTQGHYRYPAFLLESVRIPLGTRPPATAADRNDWQVAVVGGFVF